jgi:nucleotide-binding universal stress UspA family protein
MMDQQTSPTKVLVVQDGDYSQQVTDYAIKMAQKLDCRLVALDVSDGPLQFSGERKDREIARFYDRAQGGAESFVLKAKAKGLTVKHIMEVGDPEQTIAKLSKEDAGIRYVLTKPEQGELRAENGRVHIPLFDLNCSRL